MKLTTSLSYVVFGGIINAPATSYPLLLPMTLSSPKSNPTKKLQILNYLNSPSFRISKFASEKTSRLYFFDNFVRPYGVSPNNRTNPEDDEMNQTRVELLDALLPKNDNDGRKNSSEAKSRATESFQRARLAEQLRLSRRRGPVEPSPPLKREFVSQDTFQRALLEEQLRLQTKQKRFEAAMKEADDILKFRMVQREFDSTGEDASETEVNNINFVSKNESNEASVLHGSIKHGSDPNSGRNGTTLVIAGNEQSDELRGKLKILQDLSNVAISACSTIKSTASTSNTTYPAISSSSLKNFLATTHLPMPPKEDASFVSLVLAPFAHIMTSFVLLGMACAYAVCAVIDVLCNDSNSVITSKNETEMSDFQICTTRQCLKESVRVWQCAFGNIFSGSAVSGGWFQRTIKSIRASFIALFYAVKVVIVRAWKHSHFAIDSLDSGTSALRYFFYSLRSMKALWERCWVGVGITFKERNEGKQVSSGQSKTFPTTIRKRDKSTTFPQKILKLKRKYNLLRVFSNIQKYAANRFEQEHWIQLQQRRHRSEQEYKEKMMALNADRVSVERERIAISEEIKKLEIERKKLFCEMAVVMSLYAMVSEATATRFQEDEKRNKAGRKWGWGIRWFQRGDDSISDEHALGVNDIMGNSNTTITFS
ncbi:hypothetical protein ACHAXS_008887 [Conticribra weissflogii]